MANPNLHLQLHKGAEIEISTNDEGFRGAWYAGIVFRPPTAKSKKAVVQYKTLLADETGSKPLRETLDVVQLRPPPPREQEREFDFSQEVDAYFNDGWWEGVITEVLPGNRYSVFFRATREQMEFSQSELRLHREWVNGNWVPPLEDEFRELNPSKELVEKFTKGTLVEVSSDEEGFQGAWFTATVVEQLNNGNFLIEYQCLRNDDDTEFLREAVDSFHIRPNPPNSTKLGCFGLHEEVDALYNDGWWVGVISKVLSGKKYLVYFKGTDEEMEFKHTDLRPHQEWIAGKWVLASRALKL